MKAFFQWLASTGWFLRLAPRFVPRLDRLVHRLTRGRLASSRVVPALLLTTTGAKTGRRRETPLACLPEPGGTILVVGSNYGRPQHPAWTANLLKNPSAAVSFRGSAYPVTATLLDEGERAAVWPRLIEMWPVYDHYTRVSGRMLRVFRLSPMR
ncbi:nitroreductase family deazaflavin-dependent oxidoreductase [Nonomuraea typhae]|uniref:Nitroreductase family deazaflavin-dependent oxidoreductase n=1 Tax=Nonomuraea typhae TaxID=2603600 RepID=A0ABW7Z3D9_9ACTN